MHPISSFLFLARNPKVGADGIANIFQIPAPLLSSPPSFTQKPQQQKLLALFPRRRYWAVSQINCQSPGHFTASSNYILGRLLAQAGARSCGAAIVIEASLGYRWMVRQRRAKASQSSLAAPLERLYSSSPSSRGQGVLSWSSMRLAAC